MELSKEECYDILNIMEDLGSFDELTPEEIDLYGKIKEWVEG